MRDAEERDLRRVEDRMRPVNDFLERAHSFVGEVSKPDVIGRRVTQERAREQDARPPEGEIDVLARPTRVKDESVKCFAMPELVAASVCDQRLDAADTAHAVVRRRAGDHDRSPWSARLGEHGSSPPGLDR